MSKRKALSLLDTNQPSSIDKNGIDRLAYPLQKPAKNARHTSNSNKDDKHWQFKCLFKTGSKVLCRVDGKDGKFDWVKGQVMFVKENELHHGLLCRRHIRVSYRDSNNDLVFDDFFHHTCTHIPDEKHIRKGLRYQDEIIQNMDDTGKIQRQNIYAAMKRLMPRQVRNEWSQHVQDLFQSGEHTEEFDFHHVFNFLTERHLSQKQKSDERPATEQAGMSKKPIHCLADIQSQIGQEETTRKLIDTAVGMEDAWKDVIFVLAYIVGLFVAVEMDALNRE